MENSKSPKVIIPKRRPSVRVVKVGNVYFLKFGPEPPEPKEPQSGASESEEERRAC